MNGNKIASAIESVLFVHGEPLARAKLASILGISEKDVITGIDHLKERYENPASGLSIVEYGKEIELVTKPVNAKIVEASLSADREAPLGRAALEVLAIVAYRGPISRSHIEAIRGVNSSFGLRNLLLRGLIERRVNPHDSREYEYFPTFRFLETLGVSHIEELPDYQILSSDKRLDFLENAVKQTVEVESKDQE